MTVKYRWTIIALVTALVGVTVACTPSDPEATGEPTEPSSSESVETTESPEPDPAGRIVESVDMAAGGADVRVDVYPLVRSGEHLVLTLDVTTGSDEDVFIHDLFDGEVAGSPGAGGGIRLADLESKEVHLPGSDADGTPVGADGNLYTLDADGLRVQRVYAAPETGVDALGVLLPGAYLDMVPIVEAEMPAPTMPEAPEDDAVALEPIDVASVVEAPVLPLEAFTAELDGAVNVLESTEDVVVNLGGDVLFDSSSAELRPDARDALDAAVRRLEGHAPGTVEVVGHTDDVGDAASNQTLSEERAEAVADALAERIDTGDYPLETSGEGESQPLVSNSTDENRQLNRRVTLTLASEVTTATEVVTEGELSPFDDGPTATGAEGVLFDDTRTWRYTVDEARRVGDSMVIDFRVTAEDDEIDSGLGPGNLGGISPYRGSNATVPQHMLGLTVLSGSSAVYPYDYMVRETSDGTEVWNPLGELDTLRRVDGGQTATFTAVYPAIDGADTINVQLRFDLGTTPFRLTDIPVVD